IIAANAIEPDWHIQVHTVDVFVPAVGYDAFIHLFGHVSESVHDIINAPEIIRVVKIYICNYCVIGMIASKMTLVFTGFESKVITVFKAESRAVPDQERRLHITVHDMAEQTRCRSFSVGSCYSNGCLPAHEVSQENMINKDIVARIKCLFSF